MATNNAPSESRSASLRNGDARQTAKPTFTAGHAVIVTAWVVAVLLMLMAIAHVASEQVSKGSALHKVPPTAHGANKVYARHGESKVVDLEPAHIQASYQR